MIDAIKAEFRKLLTVRSTFLITGLALLVIALVGGYVFGYKAGPSVADPTKLVNSYLGILSVVSAFASIVAILLLAHEYRYNTIMYSLAAANSRSKVLLAKVVAVTTYSAVFVFLAAVTLAAAVYAGVGLAGQSLATQEIYYADTLWRAFFYVWGTAMAGLMFAALIRNVVGAVASALLIPGTVESLLGLILKDNTRFLPFNAIQQVLAADKLTPAHGALIFLAYLAVGGGVAWLLFVRRSAN